MLKLSDLRELARGKWGKVIHSFVRQVVYIPDSLTVRIPRSLALELIGKGWVEFVVNVDGDEIVYVPVIPPGRFSGERILRTYVLRRFTCSTYDRFGLSIPQEAAEMLGVDHCDLVEVQIRERSIVVKPLGVMGKPRGVNSLVRRRGKVGKRKHV